MNQELLDILALKHVRKLLAARLISNFGNGLSPIALAFGVLDLPGATAKTLSLVVFAQMFPMVAFMLIGGVIADRFPKALMVGGSDIVLSLFVICNGIMFLTGTVSLTSLIIIGVISGFLHALWWPAMSALPTEIVDEDQLQSINSVVGISANVTNILGTVTGGIIVAAIGSGWAIVLDGLTYLVAGILVIQLRSFGRKRETHEGSPTVIQDLRAGWTEFSSRSWVVVVVLGYAIIAMLMESIFTVVGPTHAKAHLGGPKPWSWILASLTAGMLLAVFVTLKVKPKRPIYIGILVQILVGIWWISLGWTNLIPLLLLGAFGAGFAMDFFMVLWMTTLQKQIPKESLSRVSSYDAFGSLILAPLGIVVAGPLVTKYGTYAVLHSYTVLFFIVLAMILSVKSVRRLANNEPEPQTVD
ncbi:MAG: MFS transporter [Actinomycetales bacterium]|nr:MFS transporter [Actinomycetales bacterium]